MIGRSLRAPILFACVASACACGGVPPRAAPPATPEGTAHDFDFALGTWRTHLRRLVHPLTGSTTWVEYDGTSLVHPVWEGRANLVELDVNGPAGHIVGLSLRLFDPKARTWSLNFASPAGGGMAVPAVGGFKNGRGEFYDHEDYDGRTILVRSIISDVTPTSYRFEQSFSEDEGKTWEPNWIAVDTRITPAAAWPERATGN